MHTCPPTCVCTHKRKGKESKKINTSKENPLREGQTTLAKSLGAETNTAMDGNSRIRPSRGCALLPNHSRNAQEQAVGMRLSSRVEKAKIRELEIILFANLLS